VPEESLMLTGDENIVDVDFSVLWRIKPNGVGAYLFNIQQPEGTVKAIAESAMREVIGRSDSREIQTVARQSIEAAVQDLMQKILIACAVCRSARCSSRRSSRPAGHGSAVRCAAAQTRARAERGRPTPTASSPRRAGALKNIQDAEAHRERSSPKRKARPRASSRSMMYTRRLTRQRMYLETMGVQRHW
jgi:membrane protease subunit HflK